MSTIRSRFKSYEKLCFLLLSKHTPMYSKNKVKEVLCSVQLQLRKLGWLQVALKSNKKMIILKKSTYIVTIMENHNIPRKPIGSCMVDPLEVAKGNALSQQDPRQIYRKPQTLRRQVPLRFFLLIKFYISGIFLSQIDEFR